MTFVGAFLSALMGTAIVGVAAKFMIELFSVSRPARFAGFCVALGFAVGRFSYGGPIDGRLLDAASAFSGALLALIGLWYWLVAKRNVQAGQPE
jgi:hypothetical protein